MNDAIISGIRARASASRFEGARTVPDAQVQALAELATRAPTAYNLQNWRLIAVRSPAAKARLCDIAFGQAKVTEAAVVYVVCGQAPSHRTLADRLRPAVDAGIMSPSTVGSWVAAVEQTYAGDAGMRRDEAIRSATLGAAFLIFAAQAHGLASCPMVGFDAERLAREFVLAADEIPVLLVAVGHAAEGNRPQKPRLPVAQILTTL
ncbi:nitroreductase family protein [Paracoccus binzhouensis]|uniref:nitroreductase family protein n=1 Tax=Paracoccus binzhouensis TaxID=2796149 RepID=UPI0018EF0782|nr:nitroreductase family protein [Paracoccus binzhouensis]